MGGQTSKGSFGMKERGLLQPRQGERVVKYRLHGKKVVGDQEGRGRGKREEGSASLLFLRGTRHVLSSALFSYPERVVLIPSFGK